MVQCMQIIQQDSARKLDETSIRRSFVSGPMAFVDVVRAGELDRLKRCAAEDCDDVVVDLSRNHSRRFCESGCGNRENVRAYRNRKRAQ